MPSRVELPGHGSELNTEIAKAKRALRQEQKRAKRLNRKKSKENKNETEFRKAKLSSFYKINRFKKETDHFMPGNIFPEGIEPVNAIEVPIDNAKNPPVIIEIIKN